MYAIVEILGQQFKVEAGKKLYVHRMNEAEIGSAVEFEDVLLIDNEGKINVGTPTIKGAKVVAEVIEHVKGDKVLVFHKKRRKGHRKLNGHRQQFTELIINKIVETGAKAEVKAETEIKPVAKPAVKVEAKAEAKPAVKKPAAKKPVAKKPAAKAEAKPAAKKPAAKK